MATRQRSEPPGAGLEVALIAAGAAVIAIGAVTAAGGALAARLAGGRVSGGLADWLLVAGRLAQGHPPTEAWGRLASRLPSPTVYWACTSAVALAAVVLAVVAVLGWRRLSVPGRERFGQPADARIAGRRDVAPLRVDGLVPPPGRMLLGRQAGTGVVLATEDRARYPLRGVKARRQGSRGSVALIGPTGSGKTVLAATAVAMWQGPAVIVSVKRDLYDVTIAARAKRGEIAVFDPAGATRMASARWSPLEAVTTTAGALRTGRALAQAIPRNGVTGADYWAKHGESLLGAFMCVAGLSRIVPGPDGGRREPVNMQQIATWVSTASLASEPTINQLLLAGIDDGRAWVKLMARHASTSFIGLEREDVRIRSSIYATARLAVEPWLEPGVAHSATLDPHLFYDETDQWATAPRYLDLDWLLAGAKDRGNTVYLCAPETEFERLSPVLGGLLADLKDQIHANDIAGRPLSKPVLFLIDEAGQLELGWLPGQVSTIAALGAFFVTCWQSLSQIKHRYGTLADTVLGGHRSKVFFAGTDDEATLRYLAHVVGTEHVARRSWSADVSAVSGRGRRSISESPQREDLIGAHVVRQMYPGEAVLLHGTLPPIHLRPVRWWTERRLRHLFPGGTKPGAMVGTCPLSGDKPGVLSPTLDHSTVEFSRDHLPEVDRRHPPAPRTTRPGPPATTRPGPSVTHAAAPPPSPAPAPASAAGTARPEQMRLPCDDPPPTGTGTVNPAGVGARGAGGRVVNTVARRCELCRTMIPAGAGQVRPIGNRPVTSCWPDCPDASR